MGLYRLDSHQHTRSPAVKNKEGLSVIVVERTMCNVNMIRVVVVDRQQQPLPVEIWLEPLPSASQKRKGNSEKKCTTFWTMVSTNTYSSSRSGHHSQQGEGVDIKFHGKVSFVFLDYRVVMGK